MSAHLDLLRFNWKPSVIRLALAALADAGPVARRVWVVRSGLPPNHFAPTLEEARRLGLLVAECPAEGLRLLVQPVEFWKERPLAGAEDFARAWARAVAEQRRLPLATEMPTLPDALAVAAAANRIPVALPDSGGGDYRIPVGTLNVERLTPSEKILEALNDERLTGTGFRAGWVEPETEADALAACAELLGGPAEMRLWGGLWRKRWRANPGGLRKVLNMVREDQVNGRRPRHGSNWGRYASALWKRFVEEMGNESR